MLNTTTNLENYARNVLGIPYVDFKEIDPRTIKMMLKVLKEAYNRYPLLAKAIILMGRKEYLNNYLNLTYCADYNNWGNWLRKTYRLNDLPDMIRNPEYASFVTAHLYCEPNQNKFLGVGILPLLEKCNYDEYQQLVLNDQATIKHREYIEANFWHEVGHMLDFLMGISSSSEFNEIIKNQDIQNKISLYATLNVKETLAEAFAEYIILLKLKQLDDGIIKDIGKLVDKTYLKYAHNFYLKKSFMLKKNYPNGGKGICNVS